MNIRSKLRRVALGVSLCGSFLSVCAQTPNEEIAKYREMLADGNPAELYEMAGEDLWKTPAGPKYTSLQACDLGLGAGVVDGAAARLPRYFADTQRVQDLESRLMTCMESLQGIPEANVVNANFGEGQKKTIAALVAYIVAHSKGMKIHVSGAHPEEKRMYALGKEAFFYQSGPYDFACASCHSADGKRIRLQDLPNLLTRSGASFAWGSWPAYRVSNGEFWTMQQRLNDCLRQQRMPYLVYGSDLSIALSMFLAKNANGGEMLAPGLKR